MDVFPERDACLDWQRDEGVKVIVDFAFEGLARIELDDCGKSLAYGALCE